MGLIQVWQALGAIFENADECGRESADTEKGGNSEDKWLVCALFTRSRQVNYEINLVSLKSWNVWS